MNTVRRDEVPARLLRILRELEGQPSVATTYAPGKLSFADEMREIREFIELANECELGYEVIVAAIEAHPFVLSGPAAIALLEAGLLLGYKTDRIEDSLFDRRAALRAAGIPNAHRSDDFAAFLARRGIPLGVPGLNDLGLTRASALEAIANLRSASSPLLGGDVFIRRGTKIVPALANWYCDAVTGEEPAAYARRSLDRAEEYIRGYPSAPPSEEPLFVFVVGRVG